MFEKVINYFDNSLIKNKKIPFLGINVYKSHKCVFSYINPGETNYTKDDLLAVFSASKPITVTGFMRLVEQNKISLDDKLIDYLPDFKNAFIIKNNKKEIVGDQITIKHLLTMSAGFNYNRSTEPIKKIMNRDDLSLEKALSRLVEEPLDFYPGEKFQYSLCHDILAAVIEKVTGMKFSTYIEKEIFRPLGMKNSSFAHKENLDGIFPLYLCDKGKISLTDDTQFKEFNLCKTYESGGAGLISTLTDYSLFADALANNGQSYNGYSLLKKETLDLIKTPQFSAVNVKSNFTCIQGNDYSYGLGMRVRIKKDDSKIPLGEFGWDGAAGTYLLVDNDNQISIVITMSVLNWPDIFIGEHLKIASLIYEELIK